VFLTVLVLSSKLGKWVVFITVSAAFVAAEVIISVAKKVSKWILIIVNNTQVKSISASMGSLCTFVVVICFLNY
jgi:hypothetical protein